jgi:endonuclease/exonuclease/phosphatase family metal-dependent hydrolase
MRVLTWNLWWRFGPWQQRRDAIRAVLRAAAADVLGLQEVWAADGRNLAAELAAELSMHWSWSPSPAREYWRKRASGADVEIGNAILSRWPIADTRREELAAGALGDGRTILFCDIRAPFGRVPFFTTQLSSPPALSAVRCTQVAQVSRFVARHAGSGFPPVLTGDLNAEPDADEMRLLCGHKTAPVVPGLVLVDAWRYADPAACADTWDRRNPYVRATYEPSARIDYVLVGVPGPCGAGHVLEARRIGEVPVAGVWPSDHAAVVVDLAR